MSETSMVKTDEQERERSVVLKQLKEWLEIPMLVLSFVWLFLVLAELLWVKRPYWKYSARSFLRADIRQRAN